MGEEVHGWTRDKWNYESSRGEEMKKNLYGRSPVAWGDGRHSGEDWIMKCTWGKGGGNVYTHP